MTGSPSGWMDFSWSLPSANAGLTMSGEKKLTQSNLIIFDLNLTYLTYPNPRWSLPSANAGLTMSGETEFKPNLP
jgi:hypothetical protein